MTIVAQALRHFWRIPTTSNNGKAARFSALVFCMQNFRATGYFYKVGFFVNYTLPGDLWNGQNNGAISGIPKVASV
jgi:hypothetical protein